MNILQGKKLLGFQRFSYFKLGQSAPQSFAWTQRVSRETSRSWFTVAELWCRGREGGVTCSWAHARATRYHRVEAGRALTSRVMLSTSLTSVNINYFELVTQKNCLACAFFSVLLKIIWEIKCLWCHRGSDHELLFVLRLPAREVKLPGSRRPNLLVKALFLRHELKPSQIEEKAVPRSPAPWMTMSPTSLPQMAFMGQKSCRHLISKDNSTSWSCCDPSLPATESLRQSQHSLGWGRTSAPRLLCLSTSVAASAAKNQSAKSHLPVTSLLMLPDVR